MPWRAGCGGPAMWNIAPAATADGDRDFRHTPFDEFALPDEITRGPLITHLSHHGKRPQVEYPGPATTGRAWCLQPLGTLFRNMRGIGGSTILGSGEVALILDVQALVSRCARSEEQASRGNTGMRQLEMH